MSGWAWWPLLTLNFTHTHTHSSSSPCLTPSLISIPCGGHSITSAMECSAILWWKAKKELFFLLCAQLGPPSGTPPGSVRRHSNILHHHATSACANGFHFSFFKKECNGQHILNTAFANSFQNLNFFSPSYLCLLHNSFNIFISPYFTPLLFNKKIMS